MNLREILDDIRSPRRKKVILDCDTANEMDDQYAVAYVFGRQDRFELLAMTAEHYHYGDEGDLARGMEDSYEEFFRVMKMTHCEGIAPVYRGAVTRIDGDFPFFRPVDTDASRAIIRHVHEAGETVYILATGPVTNITSAMLLDPTIGDKICVIWLGGNCLDWDSTIDECNLWGDYAAGQILINSGVSLIQLPACSRGDGGTIQLKTTGAEMREKLTADTDACRFYRDTLPFEYHGKPDFEHVIWDMAGPAVLTMPEAFELRIMPAPIFADDRRYAFDRTRHEIIHMDRLSPRPILDEMFRVINSL